MAWQGQYGALLDGPLVQVGDRKRHQVGDGGAAGGAAASQQDAETVNTDKLIDLWRDHLYLKNHVQQQLSGLILVVVIQDEEAQKAMSSVLNTWIKESPDWKADAKAKHPKGIKRIWMWKGWLALMAKLLTQKEIDNKEEVEGALLFLGSMEEESAVQQVAAFQCKHKEPKAGRSWVWELTLCCSAFLHFAALRFAALRFAALRFAAPHFAALFAFAALRFAALRFVALLRGLVFAVVAAMQLMSLCSPAVPPCNVEQLLL